MTRIPAQRRKTPGHRLGVQPLESRGMLAGDVAVSIGAGNVTITGDGSDNDISVTYLGGNIYEIAGNSTTINGGPSVNFQVGTDLLFNLTINLKSGNDKVVVDGIGSGDLPGVLSIGGGEGDNDITVKGMDTITGKLAVVNATGDDTVTIDDVNSVAAIAITNGKGGSHVTIGGSGAVNVSGDVTVNALADGGPGNDLTLDDLNAGGNVNVAYGVTTGSSTFDIDGVDIAKSLTLRSSGGTVAATFGASAANNIGSKLTIDFANGNHTITLDDTDVDGDFSIRASSGVKTIDIDTSDVGGSLTMNFGSGKETVDITAANIGAGIAKGNLSITSGVGDTDINIHGGTIDGNLSFVNGVGDAAVALGTAASLTIAGNASIRNGNANTANTVNVDRLTANDLSITNGQGDNVVKLGAIGPVSIAAGGVAIRNGLGDNDVTVNDTTIVRDLTINNGQSNTGNSVTIGNTDAVTIGRNLTVTDGNGDSTLAIDDLMIAGAFSFRGTQGEDDVTLGAAFAVTGATSIDTGADNDSVSILSGADLSIGKVTISMGAGDDDLTIAAAASSFNLTTPNFLFDGAIGGSDTLNIDVVLTAAQLTKVKNFESII